LRFFLTGATGFVGSYVVRRLLTQGHDVCALLRPKTNPWRISDIQQQLIVLRGDLETADAWAASLSDFRPDCVIHLAWQGVGGQYRNDARQSENVQSSLALLRLAHAVGARSWVGLGSQAEYGPSEVRIAEDHPKRPTTIYGDTKLAVCQTAEKTCLDNGMRFVWLRLFSSYGPKDDPSWMIPYVILELLRGNRPRLTGGEQIWDYLYVDDAAEAIARIAAHDKASGVFNLASGYGQPLRTLIETIRDLIDPKLPLGFGEIPYRPDQVMMLEGDVTRLQNAIGWTALTTTREGLAACVRWYSEHRENYNNV
jgi:UDP-glucose 4-epimerase